MAPLETDRWRPVATPEVLRARARMLQDVRDYFRHAGVLEVETPYCSRYGNTDPAIESLMAGYQGPGAAAGARLFLHTSPEFPMKRLLAAGSGPIYQICRVFRNGELGRLHNPEFTMLEWYRPGLDHHGLMGEVADLVRSVARQDIGEQRLSYRELFLHYLDLDPHSAQVARLRRRALEAGIESAYRLKLDGRDPWLDLLLSHAIEPRLPAGQMTFVYDYPATQASLARVRGNEPPLAERFELYLGGMELANGFHELADAAEQRSRFSTDQRRRAAAGCPEVPMDSRLLDALAAGLPDCAGVALGLDRLLMWLTDATRIGDVLAFPFEHA